MMQFLQVTLVGWLEPHHVEFLWFRSARREGTTNEHFL